MTDVAPTGVQPQVAYYVDLDCVNDDPYYSTDTELHAMQEAGELCAGTRIVWSVVVSTKEPPVGVTTVRYWGTKAELDALVSRWLEYQPR